MCFSGSFHWTCRRGENAVLVFKKKKKTSYFLLQFLQFYLARWEERALLKSFHLQHEYLTVQNGETGGFQSCQGNTHLASTRCESRAFLDPLTALHSLDE